MIYILVYDSSNSLDHRDEKNERVIGDRLLQDIESKLGVWMTLFVM